MNFRTKDTNPDGLNDAIDRYNELENYDEAMNADNYHSLVDSLVDIFSFLPQLSGPNGDSAKKALHSTLNSMEKHNNALNDALGMLPSNQPNTNPADGIPPVNPTPPEPPRKDPLVLDTDKDGFISTIALENSNTYFDITGDGIKEKVSWIGANDGILTYDKNGNGKIDGIDEVFGNLTTSGFDELRELIDSNNDGVIDRRDELFSRLKIWHMFNQTSKYATIQNDKKIF